MKASTKQFVLGIVTACVLLIVGIIIVDGDYYWLEYATILGGAERAAEIDRAALVVTGSGVGADMWVKRGDKAVLGITIMITGVIVLILFFIAASRTRNIEKIQSTIEGISLPTATNSTGTEYDRLKVLKTILDDGLITDEEYKLKRQRIIDDM